VEEDSHHPSLNVVLPCEPECTPEIFPRTIKLFHRADYAQINKFLSSMDWEKTIVGLNIEEATSFFYEKINDCILKHVPTVSIKNNNRFPRWYSKALIKVVREKLKAHKKWKRTGSLLDYDSYALLRSRQKTLQKECYDSYITHTEASIITDPKKIFNYIKTKKPHSSIPNDIYYKENSTSNGHTAHELFGEFFHSSFVSGTSNTPDVLCPNEINIGTVDFRLPAVLKMLKNLDLNKGAGLDNIPAIFIVNCADELSVPITLLFKLYFNSGKFPRIWKKSFITPIHKSGNKHNVENYRPISKLCLFSKVMEKIVVEQLTPSLNFFILPNQHGFFPGRSVETNLTHFTNDIIRSMGGGGQVDAVYTDFSKAFDKINHDILIHKLGRYGVHGDLLRWISSYIRDRLQAVAFNDGVSQFRDCLSGVPQGSHLGPILFILYINDIGHCFKSSTFLIYADDTKIYKKITCPADAMNLQADLDKFFYYCSANQLFLNISKCQTITFSRSTKPIFFDYKLNGTTLKKCNEIRDLGVTLDHKMLLKTHIDNIADQAFKQLGFILRVSQPFKNIITLKTLYFTYVRSCLEFASVIWNPQYVTYISRIERVQNKFLKHLNYRCKQSFENHTQSARFHKIDTLENMRIKFDLVFLYKIIHNITDSSELLTNITFNCPSRPSRFPSTFRIPLCNTNYIQHSFFLRVCSNYNSFFRDVDIFQLPLSKFKNAISRSLQGSGQLPI
jgi:hypothetical protein